MVSAQTLFYKYGSPITDGVSELFYDRVLADPSLTPFFEGIDVNLLRDHMSDVLSVITGGPNLYKGRDLKTIHARFGIGITDFDKILDHMVASVEEVGATHDEALSIAAGFQERRDEIVTK